MKTGRTNDEFVVNRELFLDCVMFLLLLIGLECVMVMGF